MDVEGKDVRTHLQQNNLSLRPIEKQARVLRNEMWRAERWATDTNSKSRANSQRIIYLLPGPVWRQWWAWNRQKALAQFKRQSYKGSTLCIRTEKSGKMSNFSQNIQKRPVPDEISGILLSYAQNNCVLSFITLLICHWVSRRRQNCGNKQQQEAWLLLI